MSYNSREHELRCEQCKEAPLLATYGVDQKGHPYVHVKIWKQNRIFGELVIEGGVVRIKCRACLRWLRVIIRRGGHARLIQEPKPVEDTPT